MWAVVKILSDHPTMPMVTLYDTHEEAMLRVEKYKRYSDAVLFTVVYAPHVNEIAKMQREDEEFF